MCIYLYICNCIIIIIIIIIITRYYYYGIIIIIISSSSIVRHASYFYLICDHISITCIFYLFYCSFIFKSFNLWCINTSTWVTYTCPILYDTLSILINEVSNL